MQDKQIRQTRLAGQSANEVPSSAPRPGMQARAGWPDEPKDFRQKNRLRPGRAKGGKRQKAAEDEVLAAIVDQRNGHTYYVSIIDNFKFKGIDYAVMYNYRAENYENTMPEILIMRTFRDHNEQFFSSIRDKKELDMIFDVFYNRYQESI